LEKQTKDRILNVDSGILNAGLYFLRIKSAKYGTAYRKVIISR